MDKRTNERMARLNESEKIENEKKIIMKSNKKECTKESKKKK